MVNLRISISGQSSGQPIFSLKRSVLLLLLLQPLVHALAEVSGWDDHVHGEGLAVEWVILVTATTTHVHFDTAAI